MLPNQNYNQQQQGTSAYMYQQQQYLAQQCQLQQQQAQQQQYARPSMPAQQGQVGKTFVRTNPVGRPPAATGTAVGAQQGAKGQEAAPAVKRGKKRKGDVAGVMQQVRNLLPESAVFTHLLMLEGEIDRMFKRRRKEIADLFAPVELQQKRLRVYVQHEHHNQDKPAGDKNSPPRWVLNLWGHIVDATDGAHEGPQSPTAQDAQKTPHHPFTWYIEWLNIQLPKDLYPNDDVIVWRREDAAKEFVNRLAFRRCGNKPVQIKVEMKINNGVELYTLAPWLAVFMGVNTASKAQVMQKVWEHLNKTKALVDLGGNKVIKVKLDKKFQGMLKSDTDVIDFDELGERLEALLIPVPPISFTYNVTMDGPSPSHPVCFDFELNLPKVSIFSMLPDEVAGVGPDKDVAEVAKYMEDVAKKLREHMRRRTVLMRFAVNPVEAITELIASNTKDLRIMRGAPEQQFQVLDRSDIYRGKWVEDAALRYLANKM